MICIYGENHSEAKRDREERRISRRLLLQKHPLFLPKKIKKPNRLKFFLKKKKKNFLMGGAKQKHKLFRTSSFGQVVKKKTWGELSGQKCRAFFPHSKLSRFSGIC